MLAQLAGRIVAWQMKKGILKKEDQALYQYAYELLLNQGINIAAAILIAVLFRMPWVVLTFLAAYIPLRSYAGGYHANTNWGCTVVSALMLCLVCIVVQFAALYSAYGWCILFAVSGIFIFLLSPVEDFNKPLSEEEVIHYRRMSRILWTVEALTGTALCFWNSTIGITLSFSHFFLALILCLGMLKNKWLLWKTKETKIRK